MGRAGAGAVQGGRAEWPSRGVRACASARRACARARAERACDRHAARDAALERLCVALERLQVYLTLQGGFICRTPLKIINNFTEMYWERLAPCDSTV